ncbi:MAG: efflux RND transporter periplasmic adaptor subunit [Planctomycetes bacterium]|nr:efflux RND transporter periplasmic adaptor subunit [Planctomycetota bacterium]
MGTTNDVNSENTAAVKLQSPESVTAAPQRELPALPATSEVPAAHPDESVVAPLKPPAPQPRPPRSRSWRSGLLLAGIAIGLTAGGYILFPLVETALNTVSTDDAYVNGHVTFIAPRVAGHVTTVFVDNNQRVKAGDLLARLDAEPFQVQVNIKTSALVAAKRELATALARARGLAAQARSNRFKLDHAMEDVRNQIELLKSDVAQLKVEEANRLLAEQDFGRGEKLVGKGAISHQEFDRYKAALEVAINRVSSARQSIQQTRASLGLPINHESPLDIPEDLDENFSTVQEALAGLYGSITQLGYTPPSWNATPTQVKKAFYSQDPDKNLDRIFDRLIPESPAVKQAEAKVAQAEDDLAQAQLNLRYCDIVSDIDGQVTSRNVNPGNYVQIGQGLMAVRSLTEIWIDANFKETQLADQRIGQRVRCEVDMYGHRREFEGRITGFTMGTGTTLSLLPPQNATGNFVKIVQRLPVRIELTDYDPEISPLFIGLSVVPYVYINEPPSGPHAGEVLQPFAALTKGPASPGNAVSPTGQVSTNHE